MRRRLTRALPLLLAAASVAFLYRSFFELDRVLAVRDLPLFHLPLRQTLIKAAAAGSPWWNPLIHGGQPILSNPNYAAFYPPTWLGLLLPLAAAIQLLILGHAALAFAGAWKLGRRLGAEPPAAAFAALAFTGGGALLSAPNTLNLFCAAAWIPWLLWAGDRLVRSEAGGAARRSTVLVSLGLALQLLAGEPTVVVISALGLLCLALAGPPGRLRNLGRLAVSGLAAALLGATQLLPTLMRLAGTARGQEGILAGATIWSTHPYRLAEWLLPRLFGDPMLEAQGLYFGFQMHDRGFPYLIAIYLGLLPLALGVAALARWPIPRRGAWLAMALIGVALALGRHSPLYSRLLLPLPPFSVIRYPEKFLLLATTALPFAAALGWQHLVEARRRGHPERADFPLALAGLPAALAALFLLVGRLRPDVEQWFVRHRSLAFPRGEVLEGAVSYLSNEALLQLILALAAAALLACHRWSKVRESRLAVAVLLLLAVDLGLYGRNLHPTSPAGEVLEPPREARPLTSGESRLYTDEALRQGPAEIVLRPRESELNPLLYTKLHRYDPYVANLWGVPYALHQDFDLMLTTWGRRSLELFDREARAASDRSREVLRIQGAWNVGWLAFALSPEELAEAAGNGPDPSPVLLLRNPLVLPRWRTVPSAVTHGSWEEARDAARGEGFPHNRRERCVDPEHRGKPIERRYVSQVELGRPVERFGGMEIDYRASERAFLVAAFTYDPHWQARVDGKRLMTICPTVLGQMGIELPPGHHRLILTYRDPWVVAGAAISALALLAGLWLLRPQRSASAES